MILIYIKKISCHIKTDSKHYLFLKPNGKRFHSGEILKQLSVSFQADGLPSTNTTIIRKTSNTKTYKSKNYEAPKLIGSLLDRDVGTRLGEYKLLSKDSRANKAVAFNEQLMFTKPLYDMFSLDNSDPSEWQLDLSASCSSQVKRNVALLKTSAESGIEDSFVIFEPVAQAESSNYSLSGSSDSYSLEDSESTKKSQVVYMPAVELKRHFQSLPCNFYVATASK